ncbi:MAG: glucose-6-phosphate isomerase, partial [Myxococcota bacterium]
MTVRLDYALATNGGSQSGVTDAHLDAEQDAFETGLQSILARVKNDELGFWKLPTSAPAADVHRWVGEVPDAIQDVIVLGIGGSSLGGRALYEALGGPPELREGRRLHFPDNSDPWRLARLLDALDPHKTLAIAISKSGGTVETAASFLVVRGWLKAAGAPFEKHLLAITDPAGGSLRALADAEGLSTFSIPPNVGGRFSVLKPVGLAPPARVGFDKDALHRGAHAMRARFESPQHRANPAGI